ncbi:MAG: T9SS type A sorting domain-containing protein [Ignavibacteria bacterium]
MKKLAFLFLTVFFICNFSIAQWDEQDYISSLNNSICGTADGSFSGFPVFPVSNDTLRVLVVFAKYSDDTWDPNPGQATLYWPGNLGNEKPDWSDQIIKPNTINIGNSNITAFYRDASLGHFFVIGDVYPSLYVFQNPSSYYHPDSGRHIGYAVGELLTNIGPNVDWSLYDKFAPNDPVNKRHPDGQIDCIMVIFRFLMGTEPQTGSGVAALGGTSESFGSYGTSITLGASRKYATSYDCFHNGSGLISQMLTPWGYNIACHELGHYLIGYHRCNMGMFNLMNINGNSYICSEEREFLGWAAATNVTSSGTYILPDYGTTGEYLKFQKGGYNYFLENRRRISYHLSNEWTNWPYYSYQPLWPNSRDSGLFIYRETYRIDETPIPANGKWNWQKSILYQGYYLVDDYNNGLNMPVFFYDKPNKYNGETVFDLVDKYAVNYQTGLPYASTKTHCGAGGDSNTCFDIGYNQVLSPWSNPGIQVNNVNDSFAVEIIGKNAAGSLIININFENLPQTFPAKPQCLRLDRQFINGTERFNPKLVWYKNTEPDLQKYKVYRAEVTSPGIDPANYSYIGETTDTIFVDQSIFLYIRGHGSGNCTYFFQKFSYRVTAIDLTSKESVRSERDSMYGYSDPCAPAEMPQYGNPGNHKHYDYNLYQNFPNPFNPITNIKYSIPDKSFVELKVFNVLGQEIKSLVSEFKNAGEYVVSFDASNLPSGIYFYKINYNKSCIIKKMLLIK